MVGDITVTINSVAESFSVQQFDGQRVVRHCERTDDNVLDVIVSHEETKSGITRSLAKIDESFVNTGTSEEELCTAHLVLTYASGEGKTKAKLIADGLLDWLTATSNANLNSIAAKQYGA